MSIITDDRSRSALWQGFDLTKLCEGCEIFQESLLENTSSFKRSCMGVAENWSKVYWRLGKLSKDKLVGKKLGQAENWRIGKLANKNEIGHYSQSEFYLYQRKRGGWNGWLDPKLKPKSKNIVYTPHLLFS